MKPPRQTYQKLLIDGSHLMHRATYSYGGLSYIDENGEEIFTGSVFGFLKILVKVWRQYAQQDSQLVICWEGGYKHRTALYPAYKANRYPVPANEEEREEQQESKAKFFSQMDLLREVANLAGWAQARASGYEADDTLATLARSYSEKGETVAIYSGDRDMHQCVSDLVHIVSAQPGGGSKPDFIWTPEKVLEEWSVPPSRVAEAKALAGDSGDNIPGCPGCGVGWAAKLLNSAESLDRLFLIASVRTLSGVYQNKPWKSEGMTKKILDNRDLILTSWELSKTVSDAPVQISQEQSQTEALLERLVALRFHSLVTEKAFAEILTLR